MSNTPQRAAPKMQGASWAEDYVRREQNDQQKFCDSVKETIGCSDSDANKIFNYFLKNRLFRISGGSARGCGDVSHRLMELSYSPDGS